MPRQGYQDRLDDLREDVLYLGELVADRLRTGLDALDRKDEALAREVITGDAEINQMYLDLEQDCIDLLALQQPVAGDLRFIAASFKILTDLERVGDLATNLGQYTLDANRDVFTDVDVQRIGERTLDLLDRAMTAYADEDTDACYAVAEGDDEIDDMCTAASEAVVRDLVESRVGQDLNVEELLPEVSRLLLTIRDLERVGDHAVNVAARTLYMVEADDDLIY